MGAALTETQKLKDVADEFERDLAQQKLAEAEARVAEAEALRERIAELEEENAGAHIAWRRAPSRWASADEIGCCFELVLAAAQPCGCGQPRRHRAHAQRPRLARRAPRCATALPAAGLTQTLNEFRQTTHQLQKLQSHELRRLQAVEKGSGSGADSAGARTPPRPASVSGAPADALPQQNGTGSVLSATSAGAATPRRSPRGSAAGGAAAAAAAVAAAEVSAEAAEAMRIAEQLEDVAGGAESGLLADAAAALRELSRRDAELVVVQQVGRAGRKGCAGLPWRLCVVQAASCARVCAAPAS